MNSEELKGKWDQLIGEFKKRWGKLTDNDWMEAKGNTEKFIGKLKERYGITKEEAQKQYDNFCKDNKDKFCNKDKH
jgi:uncharacterized protein YjbJ (UPF0337 family)